MAAARRPPHQGPRQPEQLFQVTPRARNRFPSAGVPQRDGGQPPDGLRRLEHPSCCRGRSLQAVGSSESPTLVGPGGVGKTRLATVVASGVVHRFPTGCGFVDLAAVRDGDLIAGAIASLLGLVQRPGLGMAETVAEALTGRELLLLLDNCEHLLERRPSRRDDPTEGRTRSRILCTSQRRLGLGNETVVSLTPLGPDEAVEFFSTRAPRDVGGVRHRRPEQGARATAVRGARRPSPGARAGRGAHATPRARSDPPAARSTLPYVASTGRYGEASDPRGGDRVEFRPAVAIRAGRPVPHECVRRGIRPRRGDGRPWTWTSSSSSTWWGELLDRSIVVRQGGGVRLLDSVRAFAAGRLDGRGRRGRRAIASRAGVPGSVRSCRVGLLTENAPQWLEDVLRRPQRHPCRAAQVTAVQPGHGSPSSQRSISRTSG